MEYLAHTSGARVQTLLEHLEGTAELAERFGAAFGSGDFARMTALAHDLGKYSSAFQRRLRGDPGRVDHSTFGAQAVRTVGGLIPAYCVAGHHGGLPDGGGTADTGDEPTLYGRLRRKGLPDCGAYQNEITLSAAKPPEIRPQGGFSAAFFIRMLFSCLVDADYLDTEAFMSAGGVRRGGYEPITVLRERLKAHTAGFFPPRNPLNARRCGILRACEAAGAWGRGLYTLTVPTGGGKTLASLAFALEHAVRHGMERVIYVIPYSSIIEQTAEVFREVLGDGNVLEHHSGYEYDDSREGGDPRRLAAENWDVPVVVTTNVQFFQSLFASKPSRCRKIHSIANSVIIFDEAQMLPQPYLRPCVRAIAELVRSYRSTCVLCTATQPNLGPLLPEGMEAQELCPDTEALYEFFRRVRYERLGQLSDEALAQRLQSHSQVLCVVSTRKQAQTVFRLLEGEGCFHLSTLLYPEHRGRVLSQIRERLRQGLPCRVVSTSLVEAGVDLDFPTVYRAEAGLDSVIQAGGRCNREGRRSPEESVVYLFRPDGAYRLPVSLRLPVEAAAMATQNGEDPSAPATIAAYFTTLHSIRGDALDSKRVVERFEAGLPSMSFPFASVAEDFRLIEEDTRSVLIPNGRGKELAERLRQGERSRALLRAAGRFCVSLYPQHFEELDRAGALEALDGGVYLLTDPNLYAEDTGLASEAEEGKGFFA